MPKPDIPVLPKLPAEAIRLAHLLEAFLQAEKSWSGLLHPDQRVLITFIVRNYDTGSTLPKATQSSNGIACYPGIWTQKEYRVKKAIQRMVDLASPPLERCWRSQLGGKSILDLPAELMLLIEHELSDNELYNLCRANRGLYHILSGRLCQRGMQDLRAFERSLRRNKRISFIKAIGVLSNVPETAPWSTDPLFHMVSNKNAKLIQFLVSKDGLLGCALRGLIKYILRVLRNRIWWRYDEPDWRSTENCLKWGADPNYRFKDGSSLLCIAIQKVPLWKPRLKPEMTCRHVKLLLDHGADPNCAGSFPDMWSPLHLACFYYQPDIMQVLLNVGADPNAKDVHGCTPLHMLFSESSVRAVNRSILLDILLADRRVKIDERDDDGCTPLHAAARRGHLQTALKFAKQVVRMPDKVDINAQDNEGETPLGGCISIDRYRMARILLEQDRLDPNLGPKDDFPLLFAVRLRRRLTVKSLLKSKRLDVNKRTSTGKTALLEAIEIGHKDIIRMLAKAGADPDIGMDGGKTPRQQMLAAGIYVKWQTHPVC
jgi:ankyrin repeat protein